MKVLWQCNKSMQGKRPFLHKEILFFVDETKLNSDIYNTIKQHKQLILTHLRNMNTPRNENDYIEILTGKL